MYKSSFSSTDATKLLLSVMSAGSWHVQRAYCTFVSASRISIYGHTGVSEADVQGGLASGGEW